MKSNLSLPAFKSFKALPLCVAVLFVSLTPASLNAAAPSAPASAPAAEAPAKAETKKSKKPPKTTKKTPYPYPGKIYQRGEAFPLCPAINEPATYAKKKAYKYIIGGKDDWLFRSVDFKQDFAADETSSRYFTMLHEALEAKGQTLVIVVQPGRAFISKDHIDPAKLSKPYDPVAAKASFKEFIKQLNDMGIYAPDLSDVPADLKYFRSGDLHWTVEGSKWSAEQVAKYFKEVDGYSDLKKSEFETTQGATDIPNRGVYYEFVQRLCEINIAMDIQREWITTPKGGDAASDLFGESSFPEIVLVGTSNSALGVYNFSGWLKEQISADIYNVSIAGGGFGSSILRYLSSEDYLTHPPKFVVWEFLAQHNYNASDSLDDFRQMIPAVYGECSDENAIAVTNGEIKATETNLDAFMTHDFKNTYMYLEVLDPVGRSLELEILYANGEGGFAEMTRDQKVANNGKYYFLLDEGLGEKAMYIRMLTDTPSGKYKAKLCPIPKDLVKD